MNILAVKNSNGSELLFDIVDETARADLDTHTGDSDIHVTASEKESWNKKSNFSGSYNDLSDKPESLNTDEIVDLVIQALPKWTGGSY